MLKGQQRCEACAGHRSECTKKRSNESRGKRKLDQERGRLSEARLEGQATSGDLCLVLKAGGVSGLHGEQVDKIVDAIFRYKMPRGEDEQRARGLVQISGVREAYAPHLAGAYIPSEDRLVNNVLKQEELAEDPQWRSCHFLAHIATVTRQKDLSWDAAAAVQLSHSYRSLMDSWLGADRYFLHASSVLVSQLAGEESRARAVHFATATPALSQEVYVRGDQTYPVDMEIIMADLATTATQRKALLVRAAEQLESWAADFVYFGLITIVSAGGAVWANSPVERWKRSRPPHDVQADDDGAGRSDGLLF